MRRDAHQEKPADLRLGDDDDVAAGPSSSPVPGKSGGASTMPPPTTPPAVEMVGIGPIALEDLVDRGALQEMSASFYKLFHVPIRILSAAGAVLAEALEQAPLCVVAGDHPAGRRACQALSEHVLRVGVKSGFEVSEVCFTGARYRILPIEYDGRAIGRILLGPYVPAEMTQPPASLFQADPSVDRLRASEALRRMPKLSADALRAMTDHLHAVLDLILFSGHKALLTSTMHVASIRESFRELTQKNAELQAAYERLKELDRLKSNFLATVSHELRTPLTSIMGYGEMLAEGIGGPLTDEQREFVDTIRVKSDQLLGLIMSLLDLSKLESGTLIVRRGPVPISEVLQEAASTIVPTAARKRIQIRIDAEADLPPVLGDVDRLRQVFINLLDNAVKFTEAGGAVVLAARLVCEDPDDLPGLILVAPLRREIEVRVADSGVGIPESQRMRVFDPFYQIDQSSTREHGGTGLGLSIVKRLIDAHNGSVRIEDNDPRGAVFVVTLPTAQGAPLDSETT